MEQLFSEDDLQNFFRQAEEKIKKITHGERVLRRLKKIWRPIRLTGLFFLGVFLIFLIINLPAVNVKLKYFWQVDYQDKEYIDNNTTETRRLNQLIGPATEPAVKHQQLTDNYLYIPTIQVAAPVLWDVAEKQVIDKLRDGVVHLAGTAKPGETQGNVFITGHSSYYIWDSGNYKTIFTLLDKLQSGDKITLVYQNKPHFYQVEKSIIVWPQQVEYTQPQGYSMLSLMTCVPLGTNLKRLIVQAREI